MDNLLASKIMEIYDFILQQNKFIEELNSELMKTQADVNFLKYEIEVLKSRSK